MRAVALLLALTLCGCAATAHHTPETLQRPSWHVRGDMAACRSEGGWLFGPAFVVLPLFAVVSAVQYWEQRRCLEARGYRVE